MFKAGIGCVRHDAFVCVFVCVCTTVLLAVPSTPGCLSARVPFSNRYINQQCDRFGAGKTMCLDR